VLSPRESTNPGCPENRPADVPPSACERHTIGVQAGLAALWPWNRRT
jgi:hypothetical protein